MNVPLIDLALLFAFVVIFFLFRRRFQQRYKTLKSENAAIKEELKDLQSLQNELRRLNLIISGYQQQSLALKKEQNQSNQVIYLSNEKAVLEQEQQKLQEKNQKLWKQSLAIFEERELIESQKKQIEQQALDLQSANEKLHELDKFKEGMLGMIVHDLKNPLNTILGLSEKPEVRQASKQMLTMVMNILDIQKLESAEMNLVRANFSFHKIVNQALSEVQFLLERKNIHIQKDFPTQLYIHVDFEILVRVIVNLLTNAIKYTANNGEIRIQATCDSSNFAQINISDNGQGIPADKLHTVFDKFSQVDARKLGSVRSTGLGLTFCKLVVEAHGGQIGVKSDWGKGSNFWFVIPKAEMECTALLDTEIETQSSLLSNPKLVLSDEEKNILLPFLVQLQSLTVFEYGKVKRVLDTMLFENELNLQRWKQQLENAVKSCNEEKYTELIEF